MKFKTNYTKDELTGRRKLWELFCAVLDAGRIQTAAGTWSNRWCTSCVNETHGFDQCPCACHPAWEYRKQLDKMIVEKSIEKAA